MNIAQLPGMLSRMSDAELQQVAAAHKNDATVLALAVAEANRRKQMRTVPQGPMPETTVADQALAGMSEPPRMATGGIVSFAEGGLTPYAPYGPSMEQRRAMLASGATPDVEEEPSEYMRQLRNVGGFFLDGADSLIRKIVSAPGAGGPFSSSMDAPETPDAPASRSSDFMRGEKKTAGLMAAADAALPKDTPAKTSASRGQGIAAATRSGARTAAPAAQAPENKESVYSPPTYEQILADIDKASKAGNKEIDDTYAPYKKQYDDERAALAAKKDDNIKMGLIQAGLGMLASKSPYALAAIGEGGAKGLEAYQQANRLDAEALKENTRAQTALMQAQRAERNGNRTQATALYGQYKSMQIAAEEMKQKAEALKETRDYHQGYLSVLRQKADNVGAGAGGKQELAVLKAQAATIKDQLKLDPTMQFTSPEKYMQLTNALRQIEGSIGAMPGGVDTSGGAVPDYAALAKAELARRAQGK